MGIITNLRNAAKIYGNIRGFSKKRNLLNVIRNYNPILAVENIKKIQTEIPAKIKKQAEFAEEAYEPPEKRKDIEGFQYLPNLSDNEIAVFKKGNKINIAYRGTKNLKDLGADTFILGNTLKDSDRYKTTKEKVEKIVKELGDGKNEYKHIGHSLGASIGKEIARDLGQKAISFNAGQSTVFNKYQKNKNYVIGGDPISNSLLAQDEDVKVFKPTTDNPHSLKNFLE